MARRFRRFSRRTRRKYRRRGFRGRKSLRSKVASINRRLAAEVKKNDNAVALTLQPTENIYNFQPLNDIGLPDYAFLYPVLDASMAQGTQMDDIIGESIKMKYLYLGFHLQQTSETQIPVSLRVMVVQDRNYRQYNNGVPTASEMFTNLFGYKVNNNTEYMRYVDVCLLPYNPLEPGRFRVIRDFRMSTAPGWRSDVYRKVTIIQSRTNSHGRIYFGPKPDEIVYPIGTGASATSVYYSGVNGLRLPVITVNGNQYTAIADGTGPYVYTFPDIATESAFWKAYPGGALTLTGNTVPGDPADQDISFTTSRNGIYVLILRQNSPGTGSLTETPQGALSIQSRFAYYDN